MLKGICDLMVVYSRHSTGTVYKVFWKRTTEKMSLLAAVRKIVEGTVQT